MKSWLLFIATVKKYCYELMMTFSNKPSLFASKRIERCIAFVVSTILICFIVYHKRNDFSATDFMIIIAPLLAYGGFNTLQMQKEKKQDNENKSQVKVVDAAISETQGKKDNESSDN